jgi:hypothetical protein
MEFDALRPILSGIAGGGLAAWLLHKLRRWMPTRHNGRPINEVTDRQRWKVMLANAVAFVLMAAAIAVYALGLFARNDWRGLGLFFGLICVLPSLLLVLTSLREGPDVAREALLAYAVNQKMPFVLLYALWAGGTIVLVISVVSLL